MTTYTASELRTNVYRIIDNLAANHKPIHITGKRHHAVMVAEEDWAAIQETLYLLSRPKMRKILSAGLKTPLKQCSKDLDW
jgi:antitoxin YefM